MSKVYIVFCTFYNGCDSWESIEGVFASEELARSVTEDLNRDNTDDGYGYYCYPHTVVTEEPNAN